MMDVVQNGFLSEQAENLAHDLRGRGGLDRKSLGGQIQQAV